MIDSQLLQAFCSDMEKDAAMSEAERRAKRHKYYVENRNKLLAKSRTYRVQNRPELSRKKKMYNRRIKSGTKKQRRRISTGSMSYGYAGYK